MKRIDRYILYRFSYNFFSIFLVLMFIFIFHTIWLFISELTGKDLGFLNILKFLFYYMPSLSYMTLPLSVIVSSILTFGALSENYELAAMKSAGMSLYRISRPLIAFMALLTIITFFIANNLIPWSEYKTFNFRLNLKQSKPSLAVLEGVFSNIGDFNIKVSKKHGKNGEFLENVVIHKISPNYKNDIVIKSQKGEFVSGSDSKILKLILKNGYYYEDLASENNNYPHTKTRFERYTIYIDFSDFGDMNLDQENVKGAARMMNTVELYKALDSLQNLRKDNIKNFALSTYERLGLNTIDFNLKGKMPTPQKDTKTRIAKMESTKRSQVLKAALSNTKGIDELLRMNSDEFDYQQKNINNHIIIINEKLALAMACLILFFVGAPLGAFIKKGGVGLPMVIAILMFLIYHFVGMFAMRYGESGSINPIISPWVSNMIMFPLGVYLTRRVMADKPIFRGIDIIGSWVAALKKYLKGFKKTQGL